MSGSKIRLSILSRMFVLFHILWGCLKVTFYMMIIRWVGIAIAMQEFDFWVPYYAAVTAAVLVVWIKYRPDFMIGEWGVKQFKHAELLIDCIMKYRRVVGYSVIPMYYLLWDTQYITIQSFVGFCLALLLIGTINLLPITMLILLGDYPGKHTKIK